MEPRHLPTVPASCSLDAAGAAAQRGRYRRVSEAVHRIDRDELSLTAGLGTDVDERELRELIEVERECCPFFDLAYDADRRELRISVDGEHARALDAVEYGLRLA